MVLMDKIKDSGRSERSVTEAIVTFRRSRIPTQIENCNQYLEPETYCVWAPKKEEGSPGSCKKSSSTGSNSKRWKFKDFIHRSNSDGKDTFVFLMPNNKKSGLHHQRLGNDDQDGNHNKQGTEKRKDAKGAGGGLFQFQEHYYMRSKDGDKRRSYLPYRPDLVGFLSNVNGVGRNLHPF
ncbi:uncharacterized protein LOC127905776 [Populus trichocarpa]|uniref:uncharacterized protein LOC127905776 n=1 Tax=Populus trichocarpa TaxID=3694 RepID=UPI002277D42A|nr:uncharacterized protein LOC127905776 [Populus trichocarpa]